MNVSVRYFIGQAVRRLDPLNARRAGLKLLRDPNFDSHDGRGLACSGPSRSKQGDDPKHDKQHDADQERDPRDVRNVAEDVAVVIQGAGEHKEHHVHDKEINQIPAPENHVRSL